MRRRQPRVLQQPQAMTAISSIFFRPQPALRSIPTRRSFCCAMISTGSCQHCGPREKQNPFISAHWAAIEPTRYVCKAPRAGMVQEETAQIRAPSGLPKARDAHTLALVLAEIASVRLHHEEDSCLPPSSDPCGRAWRALSRLREMPISVSAGVSPGGCALSLAI